MGEIFINSVSIHTVDILLSNIYFRFTIEKKYSILEYEIKKLNIIFYYIEHSYIVVTLSIEETFFFIKCQNAVQK